MYLKQTRVLRDKIRQLKSKNHGVLSVEDVEVLEECEAVLNQLLIEVRTEKSEKNLRDAAHVVGLIFRVLLGYDLF